MLVQQQSPADSLVAITAEVSHACAEVVSAAHLSLDAAASRIEASSRVFVSAAGRSGLALQMFAMRLTHLGHDAHVVGTATSPSIGAGDVLVTASGSGATGSVIAVAEKAKTAGAQVVAITAHPASPLAALADELVVIPAAIKTDRSHYQSVQYAGSLFEQLVVVLGDALFTALWHRSGQEEKDLWSRHSNLE